MKSYPSITKHVRNDLYIYCFDKIDGSQIRSEWNSKRGFYKFGSRTQLINEKSLPFGKAIPLFKNKYETELSAIFRQQKWQDVICFSEFHGPSSFAGGHNFNEEMDVTLIDVNPHKNGILFPNKFIEYFGHLDIPRVLYEGYVSKDLFDQVKQSTLEGMTFEGVVAKGVENNQLVMFKIKSRAWLNKLKDFCAGDEFLYKKLE